jgi:hypothetical protein
MLPIVMRFEMVVVKVRVSHDLDQRAIALRLVSFS